MNTRGFYPLTLVERFPEYDQVETFRFQSSEPVPFVPGQYVHLLAPASPPGPENVRHLSIASSPGEPWLQFTVDLASESSYKAKFQALTVGQLVHLFKVKGEFVLGDPPPYQAVFWAGGLGITPVRPLLLQIFQNRLAVDWALVHVSREYFLYQADLEPLGAHQFRVGRPQVEGLLDQWAGRWAGARHFVSGSARFVEGITAGLTSRGVAAERITIEDFR